jgi:putative ABC transport system permease protein
VVEVSHPVMFLSANGRVTRLTGLALPATALPTSGLVRLVSGRWPSTPDEIAVTEVGQARGLPTTGSVSVRGRTPNSERVVRVVGVVSARDALWRPLDLVTGDPAAARADSPDSEWTYLVFRDRPVSWAEVRDWNRYGLVVVSRAVVLDPPPVSQQPAELAQQTADGDAAGIATAALITIGLLLETSLLAGPAFAVSAARRRYALAQIAGNGADRAQIRRYVLGEALLLGASAAVIGAAGAVLLAWGAGVLWARIEPTAGMGPWDLPWLALLGLVLAATVSALVAALVPAWGASQVRIADVLAGRERSRPIRRTAPAVGLLLVAGAAGLLTIGALNVDSGSVPWLEALVAATLVIGVLLLIPSLLVGLGRVVGRLPLPLRLPIRDAARQRSRSASAVAAVTATVATLTILAVANASDDQQGRRDYVTDRIAGHGYLYGDGPDPLPEATLSEIRRQHPDWRVYRTDRLGVPDFGEKRGRVPTVAVVLPGCSPDDAIGFDDGTNDRVAQCVGYGSNGNPSALGAISDSSLSEADLTPEVADHLRSGGMIITDPRAIRGGVVRLALGTVAGRQSGQRVVDRVIELPALVVSEEVLRRAQRRPFPSVPPQYVDNPGDVGMMTIEGTRRYKIATQPIAYEIVDPAGPISRADEDSINDRVLDEMRVERGYQSYLHVLLGALIGVAAALVLVAALVSTALSQAEGRADLATMAALGGTVGLRRRLVACQALVVAGLGTLLGFAAGLLPGTTFALIFTTESYVTESIPAEGFVVIPWLPLAAVVVGVPLLAAAVSALAVRRTPPLTRRLT